MYIKIKQSVFFFEKYRIYNLFESNLPSFNTYLTLQKRLLSNASFKKTKTNSKFTPNHLNNLKHL